MRFQDVGKWPRDDRYVCACVYVCTCVCAARELRETFLLVFAEIMKSRREDRWEIFKRESQSIFILFRFIFVNGIAIKRREELFYGF